jgi:hypothetical protein
MNRGAKLFKPTLRNKIIIHTTSTLANWTSSKFTYSGGTITWEVTGDATGTYTGSPNIDLSGNTGTAIITVTSTDDLAGLTLLWFHTRNITYADFSGGINLIEISLFQNQITTFIPPSSPVLGYLNLYLNTGLSSIDLSLNTGLYFLNLQQTIITTITGIANLVNLTYLSLVLTNVNAIDFTNHPLLETFLGSRKHTSLDFTTCTNINLVQCIFNNVLTSVTGLAGKLNFDSLELRNSGGAYGAIDLTGCTNLTEVWCQQSGLSSINLTGCTNLDVLRVYEANLTSLDISDSLLLTELQCQVNNLGTLDVTLHTGLTWLNCSDCNLSTIDVTNNTLLTYLAVQQNPMAAFDCTQNILVQTLIVGHIDWTAATVDTSTLTELSILSFTYSSTGMSTIDISSNAKLTNLSFWYAGSINTIDSSNNPLLTTVRGYNSGIQTVDFSSNPLINDVRFDSSSITVSSLNNVIIDLDSSGVINGSLNYLNKFPTATESIANDVLDAYNNLITNGWSITGAVPA